jgi:vacuolar-type H+-ATPase subunit H
MSDFERPGTAIEETTKQRPSGSRFSELGDRLTRAFGGFDRTRAELPAWESGENLDYLNDGETAAWPAPEARFPVVRTGYDCAAVDQELAEIERELYELKASRSPSAAVSAEIDRIGEQTAAILQTAYEQAAEITRGAREQADKCVADAASNAVAITEEANRRLGELDRETDSVWQERARLIDDARGVATALLSLAEDAAERFPAETVKGGRETPAPVPGEVNDSRAAEPPEAFTPPPTGPFPPESQDS